MTTPSFDTVRYEVADHVLTLTLNRPDRLNALTRAMRRELCAALDAADADDAVRAIVVTGEGRGFCAGFDLAAGPEAFDVRRRAGSDATDDEVPGRDGGGLLSLRLFACTKPLIAAVNGPAVGIGVSMQLPMDIRIASTEARFGFVFNRRGVMPDACATWFLPRVVGISRALEWSYTGRILPAEEALAGGLVSRVVPPAALLPTARGIAHEIATQAAPVSVALTRQAMWRMLGADHPMQANIVESQGIAARGASADAREGVSAFLEKRPARFGNRVSADMPDFYPWWSEPAYRIPPRP
ncbi:crotonase/enoyl-CoA hydratase family protein [Piscinibacter sakaiensis]|uniref:Enoyl-CoA hydratase n=1 Tax=Piscinibacter sakaiensis TaxID=1547922 RepID=A0A0K8P5Y0_PISS1|nr:crotonase/enoyl-CoA hydratase family protein [Piscinibacter sakaiensis]GAP37929.1 enoyl-CoA hydratase [Piscinibacter sakaiensis]